MSSCHFCSLAEEMLHAVELGLVAASAVESVPYLQDCDECCARVGDDNEYIVQGPYDNTVAAKNDFKWYYPGPATYGSRSAPTTPYTPKKRKESIKHQAQGYQLRAVLPLFHTMSSSSKTSSPAASLFLDTQISNYASKSTSGVSSHVSTPASSLAPSVSSSFIIAQPPRRMYAEHWHSQTSAAHQSPATLSNPNKSKTNTRGDGVLNMDDLAKALTEVERELDHKNLDDSLCEMMTLAKRSGSTLLNPSAAAWTPHPASGKTHPLARTMSMTSPYA